jgi:hypothetical protein
MSNGTVVALDHKQKPEWIKKKKSIIGENNYEYNDIEVIESILMGVFEDWYYDFMFAPVITTDKNGGASVTVTVKLYGMFPRELNYVCRVGVATEYVSSIKMLQLATPKAASMAMKNAAKKFGQIFGSSLNRGIEDVELPSVQLEKTSRSDSYEEVLKNAKTKAEVESCKYMLITPELKALYAKKIKTFKS